MNYNPAELAADPDFRQLVVGFAGELAAEQMRRRPPAPPAPPRSERIAGDDAISSRDLLAAIARLQPAPSQSFPWGVVVGLGVGVGVAIGLAIAILASRR